MTHAAATTAAESTPVDGALADRLVAGFRGVAVLLLVASQLWLLHPVDLTGWKPFDGLLGAGNVAVTMLLAATGFRMTDRLLGARETGGALAVGRAFLRRSWQVSLLVSLVLLAVLAVSWTDSTDPSDGRVTRATIQHVSTFTLNSYTAGAPLSVRGDLTSLWYLSVEMQLLVVLTLVVAALGRRRRPLEVALVVLVLLDTWWRWDVFSERGWFVAALRSDVRADGLLYGALACLVGRRLSVARGSAEAVVGGAALLVVGVVASASTFGVGAYFGVQGAVIAMASGLFLGGARLVTDPTHLLHRFLTREVLVRTGRCWLSVLVWVGPAFATVARHTRDSDAFTQILLGVGVLTGLVWFTDQVVRPLVSEAWHRGTGG